jgi:hypothetical protein
MNGESKQRILQVPGGIRPYGVFNIMYIKEEMARSISNRSITFIFIFLLQCSMHLTDFDRR